MRKSELERTYRYDEPVDSPDPKDGEVTLTGQEIIDQYYSHWCMQMVSVGRLQEISEENCIDDYIVVNWAYEVKTPDAWCEHLDVKITQPTGWYTKYGKARKYKHYPIREGTDQINEVEFLDRLVVCTLRDIIKFPMKRYKELGLLKN